MIDAAEKALALWGFQDAVCTLAAARENHVYQVQLDGRSFALRLHRPGYRTDTELWSELEWMGVLAAEHVGVPEPIASTRGNFLEVIENMQVDVLTWLPGRPLGSTTTGIDHEDRIGLFHSLGREMARLHSISDEWERPAGFSRWSWDRPGLVGQEPVWGRFWQNPTLGDEDRALFMRLRETAERDLQRIESELDYGLIHADLVRENVMIANGQVSLIDFDDSGFGFRLFDIATSLIKNLAEPDYDRLQAALLAGYRSQRPIDTDHLDLFLALRSATYVGWVSTRLHEEDSEDRNSRFVENTRKLARRYLRLNG